MSIDPQRVRRSYDTVAATYLDLFADELTGKPLDRALLSVVADDVAQRGGGPIGDLGAGPGHLAAFLAALGADVLALDLSPTMATLARDRLGVAAVAGSLTAMPFGDGALGGAVAFYCLIHLDDEALDRAVEELARVILAGGPLLVAFHTGTDELHLDSWHGHEVDLDFRFLEPGPVSARLEKAGFVVEAVVDRQHYPDEGDTRRSYVLARRN